MNIKKFSYYIKKGEIKVYSIELIKMWTLEIKRKYDPRMILKKPKKKKTIFFLGRITLKPIISKYGIIKFWINSTIPLHCWQDLDYIDCITCGEVRHLQEVSWIVL